MGGPSLTPGSQASTTARGVGKPGQKVEMPKVSVKEVLEASVEHVKSKKDRKAYLKTYMREYMRKRRAK